MEKLGANSIRIYHVDPSANHDGCMEVFDKAGIYPLIDLDTFDTYILPVRLCLILEKKPVMLITPTERSLVEPDPA